MTTKPKPDVTLRRRVFYVDLRTLGLFRILLASLLCFDLGERLLNVRLYYTDLGILPRAAIDETLGSSIAWTSLHYHTGASVGLQSCMLLLALAIAISLLVGYQTRLSTLLTWGLIVSLNRRVPIMCSGGDETIRLLLFWSFFLPTGARFSVDQWRRIRRGEPIGTDNQFCSIGSAAILLQVCFVYWFTAILKLSPAWLEGTAVKTALELDFNTRPIAAWFAEQTSLTFVMTYLTLFVEGCMPFVALSPWYNTFCRWVAIVTMVGLHLGIAILMCIGIFPFASMVSWTVFVPSATWDWLYRRMGRTVSVAGSEEASPWQFETCRPVQVVVALVLLLAFTYNLLGLDQLKRRGVVIPAPLELLACGLRVDQRWGMYAPTPEVSDGWLLIPAELMDGSKLDLFTESGITYEKPTSPAALFSSPRMKKLLLTYRAEQHSPAWQWFAKYYSREWDAKQSDPGKKIRRMQMLFVGEFKHNQDRYIAAFIEYQPASGEASLVTVPMLP